MVPYHILLSVCYGAVKVLGAKDIEMDAIYKGDEFVSHCCYKKITLWLKTTKISYIFGDQQSKMVLTGLKSRYQQGHISSGSSRG